jgi:type VI secretion system protein VasG
MNSKASTDQELKLTAQLLESRQDISRQSETHQLHQELNEMQHGNPLLSWMWMYAP